MTIEFYGLIQIMKLLSVLNWIAYKLKFIFRQRTIYNFNRNKVFGFRFFIQSLLLIQNFIWNRPKYCLMKISCKFTSGNNVPRNSISHNIKYWNSWYGCFDWVTSIIYYWLQKLQICSGVESILCNFFRTTWKFHRWKAHKTFHTIGLCVLLYI